MINLAKPFIPDEAFGAMKEVLASGQLTQGPQVDRFESLLSGYLGVSHVIIVSSGTAALYLSLTAMGIQPGDEIIVPAFTFPATANVIELLGATPVFVDINLNDFCIEPKLIAKSISGRTKAIMPVHEFGQAADMAEILEIASRYQLMVIEDAACALGTEYDDKKVGTLGDVGCFSFHPRKTITTGEGGAIVTHHPEIAEKVRCLRNHGMVTINGRNDFRYAGFNYRMTDFQAALGLTQFLMIEELIKQRIQIATLYDEKLSDLPPISLPARLKNRRMVYQTYHILLNPALNRKALMDSLRDSGIETNIGAYALPCLSYYHSKYGLKEDDFPNALEAYRQGLALPMGGHIQKSDVMYIRSALSAFLLSFR